MVMTLGVVFMCALFTVFNRASSRTFNTLQTGAAAWYGRRRQTTSSAKVPNRGKNEIDDFSGSADGLRGPGQDSGVHVGQRKHLFYRRLSAIDRRSGGCRELGKYRVHRFAQRQTLERGTAFGRRDS